MKGKNNRVLSPHYISARKNEVSLNPNIPMQVTTKIVVRPLQSSGRK